MGKQIELFQGYEFPTTNTQEILLTLILQGYVSLFDFPYLASFRTRISELNNEYGLKLNRIIDQRNNKFGNSYYYAIHHLSPEEKENAILLYKKLNKNYKTENLS
jgi:hypothetical protein